MERAQKELLELFGLSPFDPKLRLRREQARTFFERLWPVAARRGVVVSEEDTVSLYVHCLVRMFQSDGVEVSHEALPCDEKIIGFLSKELP
jgi:hypothetical protein